MAARLEALALFAAVTMAAQEVLLAVREVLLVVKEAESWLLQLLGLRPLGDPSVRAWPKSFRTLHRTMTPVRPPCRSSCKRHTCS